MVSSHVGPKFQAGILLFTWSTQHPLDRPAKVFLVELGQSCAPTHLVLAAPPCTSPLPRAHLPLFSWPLHCFTPFSSGYKSSILTLHMSLAEVSPSLSALPLPQDDQASSLQYCKNCRMWKILLFAARCCQPLVSSAVFIRDPPVLPQPPHFFIDEATSSDLKPFLKCVRLGMTPPAFPTAQRHSKDI